MARILVTDGEQRSTLAAVRSLGRCGHHVVVAGRTNRSLAAASRWCVGSLALPSPDQDMGGFRDAVTAAVEAHGIELTIPMTDRAASALLELREDRPELRLPFPPRALYEAASDKLALLERAAELGVPVPDQVLVADANHDANELGRRLGWPLILKPWRSEVRRDGQALGLQVRLVEDAVACGERLAELPDEAFPVLAQRRVVGPGLGVFVLARDGEIRASFAHRRLREKPPTGGVSTYRESVPVRDDLMDLSGRLMRSLHWTGVAMVEFKEDERTGTPYLMEINARFWGSLQLAIDAGVDFPRLLVSMTLGEDPAPVTRYRTGIRSRWLLGDFDHLLWVLRATQAQRRAAPELPGRIRALGRFLRVWWPGDRWEVLRLSDPRPFLRECATWLRDLRG